MHVRPVILGYIAVTSNTQKTAHSKTMIQKEGKDQDEEPVKWMIRRINSLSK